MLREFLIPFARHYNAAVIDHILFSFFLKAIRQGLLHLPFGCISNRFRPFVMLLMYTCRSKERRIITLEQWLTLMQFGFIFQCFLEPPKCLEKKWFYQNITSSSGQLSFHRTNTDKWVQNLIKMEWITVSCAYICLINHVVTILLAELNYTMIH